MKLRTVASVAAAGLLAAGVGLWLNRPRAAEIHPEVRSADRRHAEMIRGRPRVDASDAASVAKAITAAPAIFVDAGDEARIDQRSRERLGEVVGQTLEHYALRDADRYIAWMKSRGYRWTPAMPPGVEIGFRAATGSELPADASREFIFRTLFDWTLTLNNAAAQIKGVAVGPGTSRIVLDVAEQGERWDDGIARSIVRLSREEQLRWYSIPGGSRSHFRPPITADEVMKRDGSVTVAEVKLGCFDASDNAFVGTLFGFYDPAAGDWHFENVVFSGADVLRTGERIIER